MPQINLTTLSGQELRQRLDSSRARGDAALAYEILREMAARRAAERERRPLLKRRSAEPRIVDIDLGDPLDRHDDLPPMPHWRAPEPPAPTAAAPPLEADPLRKAEPAPEAQPPREAKPAAPVTAAWPREAEPPPQRPRRGKPARQRPAVQPTDPDALPHFRTLEPPLTLGHAEPALDAAAEPIELRLASEPPEPPARRAPRSRQGLRVAAGFAAGIACGAALGWFGAGMGRGGVPSLAAPVLATGQSPAPPARVLEVVADAPVAAPEPAQAAPAEVAEAAPATQPPISAPAAPPVVEAAEAPNAAPSPQPADACAGQPTPADREICADPALQRLQRDLRRAYADALDAHEDRALLRERQLAWRDARNDVTDPGELARLYEQRIRRLEAAAAEARSLR